MADSIGDKACLVRKGALFRQFKATFEFFDVFKFPPLRTFIANSQQMDSTLDHLSTGQQQKAKLLTLLPLTTGIEGPLIIWPLVMQHYSYSNSLSLKCLNVSYLSLSLIEVNLGLPREQLSGSAEDVVASFHLQSPGVESGFILSGDIWLMGKAITMILCHNNSQVKL